MTDTRQPVVAVLGCGPAGLIAAQTAQEHGARVHVMSKPRRSYIAGAQYLHSAVPAMTSDEPDGQIVVRRKGTRDGYATKVYGWPDAPVSWDRYEDRAYDAWNMQELYDRLWRVWEHRIAPLTLTPAIAAQAASGGVVGGAADGWGGIRVDGVVAAVPLPAICTAQQGALNAHTFTKQGVYIMQRENPGATSALGDNHIIYNGSDEEAWYRHSFIFGHEAYEWPDRRKPPVEGVVFIEKPLANDCTCYDEVDLPWLQAGRMGGWHKDTLVHEVPAQVAEFVKGLQ